jgi:type I restriction enzyme R subunit
LLDHFQRRQEALKGKAMAVCMSRRNCVTLYDALTALPGCPPVKIVMTGNLAEDPKAWSEAGHITTKAQREDIKAHFIDPDDPLKIVIVCDMWLTGFDAPCVNTMYVDKPMKGHNLMQAIARVNRLFRDKPGGLIVDYIGISDQLKEATRKYTAGGGRGTLVDELTEQALSYFFIQLQSTRSNLPSGQPYERWRDLSNIDLEDLCHLCYGTLGTDEALLEDFLDDERRLSKAFSLVSHLDEVRPHLDEVAFYQMIRKGLRKLTPEARKGVDDLERAVQDLLDESITAQPAVDIFAVAGLEKPDISILDEQFLAGFRARANQDLQARLLAKLMNDDLYRRRRQNIAQYRSFKQMLDEAITRYNNGAIQAADVIQVMVEIRRKQLADEQRKAELGLDDEELGFYDVILHGAPQGLPTSDEWIAELVHEVVAAVRGNLKVDWTKAHRRDVHASVQSAVSRVLHKRRIKGEQFKFLLNRLMKQAEATYEDWPMAA